MQTGGNVNGAEENLVTCPAVEAVAQHFSCIATRRWRACYRQTSVWTGELTPRLLTLPPRSSLWHHLFTERATLAPALIYKRMFLFGNNFVLAGTVIFVIWNIPQQQQQQQPKHKTVVPVLSHTAVWFLESEQAAGWVTPCFMFISATVTGESLLLWHTAPPCGHS